MGFSTGEIFLLLFFILLGAAIGAALIYYMMKASWVSRTGFEQLQQQHIQETALRTAAENNLQEMRRQAVDLQKMIRQLSAEKEDLQAQNAGLAATTQHLEERFSEQKAQLTELQQAARNEFQILANQILDEKTQKFTQANQENLNAILKPLGENLESFRRKVDEVYQNEARERHTLNATIKLMLEQTSRVSQEANNLASALKGQTKVQGDWGELILETLLENSGLVKGREFFAQQNFRTEGGQNQRPDFVLKLPGNQLIILDSKVSLNAYERMSSAEDEETRRQNLNLHLIAVKKHIDTLAEKKYHDLKESPDFTIMFIPIESAFLIAMQADQSLWNYAYQKQIILLSPTNLIAYLKLISDVWKREHQNQNALEIARQAGALYDKFVGFTSDLLSVGKKMDDAKADYENAMKKLASGSGNLVTRTQKLKKLGASTNKTIATGLLNLAEENSEENREDSQNENFDTE